MPQKTTNKKRWGVRKSHHTIRQTKGQIKIKTHALHGNINKRKRNAGNFHAKRKLTKHITRKKDGKRSKGYNVWN